MGTISSSELDKAGGPAFPGAIPENFHEAWPGMSLRDYFAAAVLPAAYDAAPSLTNRQLDDLFSRDKTDIKREETAAALAYRIADAMISQRNR